MTAARMLCVAAIALLSACGRDPAGGTPPREQQGADAARGGGADAQIGTIYVQTCMACHTSPGSGAPQAGDVAAWKPRLAQGMDVLLDHAIDGYKGMPPLGSCMDCSEAQFAALIRFMAGTPATGSSP